MKVSTVASTIFGLVLVAGVSSAQQAPAQQPPAKPPAAQVPAQPPAAQVPAQPAAAPAPAPKFPEGARFAYINIQRIAAESAEGKASTARLEALRQKKASELNERNKALEANQNKLRSSVMSADAQAQVQKDIDKQQVDIQRLTQDAQAELQDLQNELQVEFQRKLGPIIQQVATEKSLLVLFSQADSGMVWADPGLDVTADVIRRFDAAAAAAAKPKAPAPRP